MGKTPSQFLRFLVVGVLNTGFSFGVFAALSYLGLHYTVASFAALIAGIISGHWLHGTHVFGTKSTSTFINYVIIWVLLYAINVALIGLSIRFGASQILGGAIAVIFVIPVSYLLQRFIVFRQ